MTGNVRQYSVVGLAIPPQEAIQIARRVLATEGYQSVAVGPTAATFVRDVRPQAVTIAAYALAIPTIGLSLFGLLFRTQESCTVTGETSRRGTGTALSLSGVVTSETLQSLENALRGGAPSPGPQGGQDDGYGQFPTPGRGGDNSGPFPGFPAVGREAQRPVTPSGYPQPGAGGDADRSNEYGSNDYSEDDFAQPSPLLGRGSSTPPPLPSAPPRNQPPARVSEPLPSADSGADLLKRPRRAPLFPEVWPEPSAEPTPPVRPAPPAFPSAAPAFPPAAPPRSAPPTFAPPSSPGGYSESDMDMTVVRAAPLAAELTRHIEQAQTALPHYVLTLDDGRTIDVPDFALIGRDPEPTEDDPEAGLVSMVDPEMSVSKTHASFGVDDEGLWFLDRFSTNGTSMQAPGGERIGLEPGIATPVEPGSDVWIGRRHLKIDYSDN